LSLHWCRRLVLCHGYHRASVMGPATSVAVLIALHSVHRLNQPPRAGARRLTSLADAGFDRTGRYFCACVAQPGVMVTHCTFSEQAPANL
jgi:hypothetical protein